MFNVIDVDWPAISVPVQMRRTGLEATWDDDGEEYTGPDVVPAAAD